MAERKHSRRYFIQSAGIGLLAVTAFLWDKLVKTEQQLTTSKKVSIPFNSSKNLSFHNDFIIVNKEGKTKVFSSHCTHLGCTIKESQHGKLLCPCHGSAFDTNGTPLKGPATRPLETMKFSIEKTKNIITVEV